MHWVYYQVSLVVRMGTFITIIWHLAMVAKDDVTKELSDVLIGAGVNNSSLSFI